MKMARLTSSGHVSGGSISPDGKYAGYAVEDTEGFTLRIRHVATGSDVQVVPPLPTPFRGACFSPDNNYIYYVNQETGGPGYSLLYQVPVLGGPVRKLLWDIDSAVSFSPDGKEFAFLRGYPDASESVLMVANANGTGERKLAVHKDPAGFPLLAPSWSPDGKRIAAISSGAPGEGRHKLVEITVADGKERVIGDRGWFDITGVAWLPDGSALALAASDQRGSFSGQIWLVSYPRGEPRRVSNDLNDYEGISITADATTLATVQTNLISNLWVVPASDTNAAKQITSGSAREDAIVDLAAASSGSVVFTSRDNGAAQIYRIGADGTRRTPLTLEATVHANPTVSRDGKVIAFTAIGEDNTPHIWTMDADGGDLK
ncbi:MAG: TolB family protein, partial [Thermoplasmata archaeon]